MPDPSRKVTTEDVLDALRERDRDTYPVMTSSDVTKFIDASRPIATDRLKELHDERRVHRTKVGNSSVWWPADEKMGRDGDVEPVDLKEPPGASDEAARSDGGVSPGAQMLIDWGIVTPTNAREREAAEQTAKDLMFSATAAIITLLGGVTIAVAGPAPTWIELGLGIFAWGSVAMLVFALLKIALVWNGWYQDDTQTDELTPAEGHQ